MADAITIDVKDFSNLKDRFITLKQEIGRVVDDVLNKGAEDIATMAKVKAPKDMGGIASSISAVNNLYLEKHITANVFYAPFMEFGTGKYAAIEVAKLPADWQQMAATFKGQKGSGTFYDFVNNILDWVLRVGLSATFSVKSQRRQKQGKAEVLRAIEIAYLIAHNIMVNGVHPHPFMFPSYEHFRPIIIKEVETALKGL